MNKQFLGLLTLLLLSTVGLHAQITGTVTESSTGDPIPGAVVMWQGTTTSTTTNPDGQYNIEKPTGAAMLMVHASGYGTVSKSVISRTGTINFNLLTNTELEEVSITERGKETGIDVESAQMQMNINRSELRKAACCNLSESFETNASVDVSFTDAVTGTKQIEMLGLAGKYVLIQRENIPFARGINSNMGLSLIPGPFVESIQLTKGLSSVVNGYESISGQINVEFEQPSQDFDFKLNGYVNQGARFETNAWINTPVSEKVDMGTLVHYSNVPFAQDRNGDGFADMPTGEQFNLHNRWKYLLKNGWGGQIGFNVANDTRSSGQTEGVFDEAGVTPWLYDQTTSRYELFGKNGWVSTAPYRSLGLVYSISSQNLDASLGDNRVATRQNSVYFNSIYQDILGNTFHKYKTGISFQYDAIREIMDTTRTFEVAYNSPRNEIVPGAYFEYTYSGEGSWTIVSGLRLDYHNLFGTMLTPRMNVKYQAAENTTLRIGGGRGMRTANVITENISGLASGRRFSILSSNTIQQERAWNIGASVSQVFLMFDRGATVSVDGFYTWFDNKLIADYDLRPYEYSVYFAEGSRSTSLLAQLDFEPLENLEVRVAYKYLDARDAFRAGEEQSFGVPKHRSFANVGYHLDESGWKFDVTYNWFGSRRLLNTDYYANPLDSQSPSYSMVHLQVNKRFGEEWDVYAGVENLLNYRQDNPILNTGDTGSRNFETNRVYAPIFGRMIYIGFYYNFNG
ncbi:MAG: TonB-dependent receptor [Flavobacteriia bacterium]|nr:TonB-dependent receptor [Flavobacteriia bacterium]